MRFLRCACVCVVLLAPCVARADDAIETPTRMRSATMVVAGTGSVVLGAVLTVCSGVGLLFATTRGACGCPMCNCGAIDDGRLALATTGVVVGGSAVVGGIVLIALGAKRVPLDPSVGISFTLGGMVARF